MTKQSLATRDLLTCLLLTAAIELVCVVLRFGFDLESTTETTSTIGHLTFGYRIHHGYVGLLMIPLGLVLGRHTRWGRWTLIVGVALFASDLIHHFLVLWPITGSPDFDLVYPPTPPSSL